MSKKLALNLTMALRKNLRANVVTLPQLRKYGSEKSAEKPSENLETTEKQTDKTVQQDVEKLNDEINSLREKNDSLMDKYKRALAESENMRNRLTKQINDAKIFGIQSFCKDLLEVADTLGHATAAVPLDEVNDKNPHLKNLYQGLSMTQSSLMQIFKRHGLEQVNPINEKFDPNLHEALFQKPDPNVAPDTIVEVTKLGYKLHDRCIRPALVGVAKAP